MENLKRTFGGQLKRLRRRQGITRDSIAAELGVAPATITNWEQGRTWPEMSDFLRLCTFFKVDADYLLGRIKEQTHDLDFVCKYTGLAAEAVKRLNSQYDENGWIFDEQSKALISRLIMEYNGKYHDLYSYIAAANDSHVIAIQSENGGNVDTWKDNSLKALGVLTKSASTTPGTVIVGARQATDFNLSEAARVFREFINSFVKEQEAPNNGK